MQKPITNKMKTFVSILFFVGMTRLTIVAGDSFSGGRFNEQSTAVSLIKKADYISVPITISSSQGDPVLRLEEMGRARKLLVKGAEESKEFQVYSKWFMGGSGGGSSWSSAPYSEDSSFQMQLLFSLASTTNEVFQEMIKIRQFISGIKPPGKATFTLGGPSLVVGNTAQYRKELVAKIGADVRELKEALGTSGRVSISGFENPITSRPIDDQQVEILMQYHVEIQTAEK
ncbi:MAG: hypothetical protein JWR19_3454 [Pedosphaera sp.]|nr:hypothetical protein [Pedosphaera sp.]